VFIVYRVNYEPLLYRFRDKRRYWSRNDIVSVLTTCIYASIEDVVARQLGCWIRSSTLVYVSLSYGYELYLFITIPRRWCFCHLVIVCLSVCLSAV